MLLPIALLFVLACSPRAEGDAADSSSAPATPAVAVGPAAALDEQFQRMRRELNAEAAALMQLDRSSDEYAKRYEAWTRDAAVAERLRSQRDSVRRAADPRDSLASTDPAL